MRKKQKEKNSRTGKIITIILAVLTVAFAVGCVIGIHTEKQNKKAMEADLISAVNNCISVCMEKSKQVEIKDIDFENNILKYVENINAQQEVLGKAYITLTMTTYAIDTINLNNPKTNYELALELGDHIQTEGYIENYEPYAAEILEAENAMLDIQNKYLGITEE